MTSPDLKPGLARKLRELVGLYLMAQRHRAHEHGFSQNARLLMLLKRHGPTVQREFGRMAGLDKSWISRIVERFVADGLVERLPLETDRRCLVLHLTAAGEAEASRFDVMLNEQALKLFESIPAGEYPGLDASLMTLMDALRPLAVRKER